jgi:hypothetical protein
MESMVTAVHTYRESNTNKLRQMSLKVSQLAPEDQIPCSESVCYGGVNFLLVTTVVFLRVHKWYAETHNDLL